MRILQIYEVSVLNEYPIEGLPEKYQRRRKQFVEVIAVHHLDGSVCPRTIILSDGRKYDIDRCHDPRPSEIEGAENHVMRYSIWMKEQKTYLFEANGRWWVLMKQ